MKFNNQSLKLLSSYHCATPLQYQLDKHEAPTDLVKISHHGWWKKFPLQAKLELKNTTKGD